MNREIAPASIAPTAANYAHAVFVDRPTAWLHTSGIVAARPDGSVPESLDEQAEVIWSIIMALLAEVEMAATDVVSITTYVVHGHPLDGVMAARDAALGGHRAASTLLPVPALARPQWLMEIAVVAAR